MDFELHLIKSITNNFSKHQEVGSGAYGAVYRAKHNGEEIAVKRLHALQGLDDKEFDNEFRNFTKICHKNVVRLIGYCYESQEKFVEHNGDLIRAKAMERVLCFEYMQRGSLEKYIGDESCELDWRTCYEIIKGTCEGLNHLHTIQNNPIFHLDMKPANILLDNSMAPKIGDLGLSKLVSSTITYKTEVKKGTYGYMPPEYINNGFVSNKFDVFSLGVIIIKMMAGNLGHIRCFEMSTKEFIELLSENWKEKMQAVSRYSSHEICILQVRRCIEIALRCIRKDRKERPDIKKIVRELEELEVETKKIALHFDRSKDLILQRSCDTNDVAVDPALELRFLEPRKEVSCCLQLTNKTDGFLAFNIKVNKNKYRVQPSIGTMPPCSKRYVAVTLRAQEAAPPNMQCHDMLLVQSATISEQLASEDGQISYQEVF